MKMRSPIIHTGTLSLLLAVTFAVWPATLLRCVAQQPPTAAKTLNDKPPAERATATLGGGCFWCVEAVFENVPGVIDVVSGYAGGTVGKPTYEMVKTGLTGHAEVCQISYDPAKITYRQLLEIFMKTHDPTTKNRQGPDYGTQYRSVIFYHNDEQKADAEQVIAQASKGKPANRKIVTTLEPFTDFYLAEEYHQDYFRKHPDDAYCMTYARPKVAKVKKVIRELDRQDKKESEKK